MKKIIITSCMFILISGIAFAQSTPIRQMLIHTVEEYNGEQYRDTTIIPVHRIGSIVFEIDTVPLENKYFFTSKGSTYVAAENENGELNICWDDKQLISTEFRFPIVISREAATIASRGTLQIEDNENMFEIDNVVEFQKGQLHDTIWVQLLDTTKEPEKYYSATISIAAENSSQNVFQQITIKAGFDYFWESAGSVIFQSQWEGVTTQVPIEWASNYTDTNGNLLYRLNSPYYYAAPAYCTVPGLHIQFLLDKDYNAVTLNHPEGLLAFENTGYYLYWDVTGPYAAYCQFINQGNSYAIVSPWSDGSSLYGPYQEMWQWIDGYPLEGAEVQAIPEQKRQNNKIPFAINKEHLNTIGSL